MKSNSFFTMKSKCYCEEENYSAIKKLQANSQQGYQGFHSLPSEMASSSSRKARKGFEMLVQGVKWKEKNFKLVPMIVETLDPSKAQSQIPPKVLLINDIRTHFKCSI